MSKYILVTSGVCSGLGKGVATAAIGSLLESAGLKVAIMKCDPYINLDAGTISPYQQGEVFVTEDGAETDSDLGNYARFTSVSLSSENLVTIGKVYDTVIKNERNGRYNGRTVQVIPHITNEIRRRITTLGARTNADVVIVEIGGTVGDIESIPFLEMARQLLREQGKSNCLTIHLTLVPTIIGDELKTKPTQQSVKKLQETGIQPDILLCRCDRILDEKNQRKIAMFCNVSEGSVFTSTDIQKSVYELPILFHEQGLDKKILEKLKFEGRKPNTDGWKSFIQKLNSPIQREKKLKIAMVGKKDYLDDCFKSVRESIFHAAVTGFSAEFEIKKIDAETLEGKSDISPYFDGIDGIVIPGNYGQRGFLGLLQTVNFARENKIPFLGIDLGMQLMAIESARNLLGWQDADSTEFMQNLEHAVILLPEEQSSASFGLMKLGASNVKIKEGSKLFSIYKTQTVSERHRSKYAFNKKYETPLSEVGLKVVAVSEEDGQTEAFEWENHPWGIGVQFHPEFRSRPNEPHPLFEAFIGAIIENLK